MEKTKLFEQILYDKDCNEIGKIAILYGGTETDTPKTYMDKVVRDYVGNQSYVQLVDINLDNPWLRVVIKGINSFEYNDLTTQKL